MDIYTRIGLGTPILTEDTRDKEVEEPLTSITKIPLKTERETSRPPKSDRGDDMGKLPFSELERILKDFSSSSNRLAFIEENINSMPGYLSVDELYS